MYIVIPGFILLSAAMLFRNYTRKRRILQKIFKMPYADKSCLLAELASPYGLSYLSDQDMFIPSGEPKSNPPYAHPASSMHSVLDQETVCFNYLEKTWMFVFWKGSDGIHTGAWTGIYHADMIVPPALRPQTVFHAASKKENFSVKMRLIGSDCPFFSVTQRQWLNGGFITGICCNPKDLLLEVSFHFPDMDMCSAFTRALLEIGYQSSKLLIEQTSVQFYFTSPKASPLVPPDVLFQNYILYKNHIFCKLFLWMTEPFFTAADRLIYLYYTHPFLFKRVLTLQGIQKNGGQIS